MKEAKFSIGHNDEKMLELISSTDHKILAVWAIDCAERVLPYFEKQFPKDSRPRAALATLQNWVCTGVFNMMDIRKASLDSHRAAREVNEDCPARSAARSAGQAVATAHVPRHAYGAAIYAQQAVFRASPPLESGTATDKEREWQYRHLIDLNKTIVGQ